MIVVDSGIWIDRFRDNTTIQTIALDRFLTERRTIAVGDLVLMEVLQGARHDRQFAYVAERLARFHQLQIADPRVVLAAAQNYRLLRDRGITVRKTIDTLIATRCILDGLPLLYSDRDFDPFVEHLGLRSALDLSTGVY